MNAADVPKKILSLTVLAIFVIVNSIRADDTNSPASPKIDANAADKHYGENAIVTGRVAQVTIRPKAVFINLDQPYPNSPFTGVVFSRFTNQFSDLTALEGKVIKVGGLITNYQNKPEIILTNASQLIIDTNASSIADDTNAPAPVTFQANAAVPPSPPKAATPSGDHSVLLWVTAYVAGGLALLVLVRILFRRSSARQASGLMLNSTANSGVELAMPEAVRAGVIANISHWLKQHMVQRLISDRAQLLETQQAATLKVLAVDERLAKIEHQIDQRNQDYERRIDELLKALITAEAENRELIRAQITFLRGEMEKSRLEARQHNDEHTQH
jgi:hypothetical protein